MSKRTNYCVLCIGDDPVHLNFRCAFLKEHGWKVISSGGGHEGIIRFGQEQVDVVIVDLNDGGSEFALVAGELKRLRPHVPIIMLATEGKDLVPGAADQADAVVGKSEDARSLVAAVETLLDPP